MKKNIIIFCITMKKYILALLAPLMAMAATAQSLTPYEEREFYQKAYALIQEYVQTATVNNEEKQYRFRQLFPSGETQIYNDLMGLAYAPTLSVDDYIKVLGKARTVNIEVKNIRKGQISDTGDSWQLPLMFEKSISFANSCGTLFESREFFGKDYRLQAFIMKEKSTDHYYIAALAATDDNGLTFPENYTVLVKNDDRDINLEVNGRLAAFNRYDQILLRPNYNITYQKRKVNIRSWYPEGEMPCADAKIVVDYSDKSWRIRPNFGYSFSGYNKVGGSNGIKDVKSNEMSFGLDFGYVFPSKSHLFVGVFAGVGMSINNLKLSLPAGVYTSENQTDIDDDVYTRHYKLEGNGMMQELKGNDITIPFYFDFEYKIAGSFSLYSDLGVKASVTSGKFSGEIYPYETYGVYEQYEGLTIKDVPILGFENHGTRKTDITIDDTGISKTLAIDGLIGAGLRVNFGKPLDSFAFDAGFQYQLGLTNSWKGSAKSSDFGCYVEGEDHFYNVIRRSDGIKHNAFRLFASIIYKF